MTTNTERGDGLSVSKEPVQLTDEECEVLNCDCRWDFHEADSCLVPSVELILTGYRAQWQVEARDATMREAAEVVREAAEKDTSRGGMVRLWMRSIADRIEAGKGL